MNEWFDADAPGWRLAGWTMLHFLWIGALVAALGAAVRMACRRAAPGVRYGASLAMLAALALAPVVIAAVLARDPAMWEQLAFRRDATTVGESLRDSQAVEETSQADDSVVQGLGQSAALPSSVPVEMPAIVAPAPNEFETAISNNLPDAIGIGEATIGNPSLSPSLPGRGNDASLARLVAWLPALWVIGTPLTFAWLAAGLIGSRRLRGGATELDSGPAFDACLRLSRSLGVVQRVAVATCERVVQPVLVGIVRPVILLPAAALSGWSPEELEMVLVHELAHVRRWDNLVNLGQRIVESVLFFHPCVWLASRQVRRDREECCDALVVRHTQRPEAYASLLVSIAAAVRGRQPAALVAASALGGHPLKARVRRILKLEDETMRVSRGTVGAAAALVLAMLATAVLLPTGGGAVAEEAQQPAAADDNANDAGEENYIIVYKIDDVKSVDLPSLIRFISQLEISWHEDSKGMVVSAPQRVHEQIAGFLEKARRGGGAELDDALAQQRLIEQVTREDLGTVLTGVREALHKRLEELNARRNGTDAGAREFELTKLRSDITIYQQQLIKIDEQLVELEAMKQVSLDQAKSPAALEQAIQAVVDKDPTVNIYKEQLFQLELQIQALEASATNESKAQLNRYKASYSQLESMMDAAESKIRKATKEQLEKMPNEYLRQSIVEYNVKSQYFTKQKKDIEAKLKTAEQKLSEMATDDPETGMLEQEIKSQQMLVQILEQKIDEWRDIQKQRELSARAADEPWNLTAQVAAKMADVGRVVAPGEVLMTIEDGQTWVDFPAGVPQDVAKKSLDELQAAGWELEDVDGRWRLIGRKAATDDDDAESRREATPTRSGSNQGRSDAMKLYYEGRQLLQNEGQLRQALAAFNQALAADSTFVDAHLGKGDALKAMQLLNEAVGAYSNALQYDPNLSAAYTGRAECYLALTPPDYVMAAHNFNNALNLDRDNAAALAGLGRVYVNMGQDAKRAVAILDEALVVDPRRTAAYRDRGLAYAQLREFEPSVADLQKAIELDPEDYKNFSTLAAIYRHQRKYREAVGALSLAIDAYKPRERGEPSVFLAGYLLRADARLKLAESEARMRARTALLLDVIADADAVLARYEDRFPESAEAYFRRGKAERLLERYGDAIDSFSRAIEMVPAEQSIDFLPTAYMWRGICFHRMGSVRQAGADFKRVATTFGERAVEEFKIELDRVSQELARKQEELNDRSAGGADNVALQILREDVESHQKLASRLEQILAKLQPRASGFISPGEEATVASTSGPLAETTSQKARPANVEPPLFAYAKLLGEAPELGVTWSKEFGPDGENVTIHAPQPVQDALALVEGFLERVEGSPAGNKELLPMSSTGEEDDAAYEEFNDLFRSSNDNPLKTMTHSVEAFDKLVGYENAFHDVLMGLVKDPYGPKLAILVKSIDDGKQLVVTAAQGGQALLRLVLAEDSPVLEAVKDQRERERAAEDAEEAGSAVEAANGGQQPWIWKDATWPADISPEDKQRITGELAEAGVRVQASGSPDSRRFEFAVEFQPGQGANPMLVWEEQLVDGQRRMTARLVYEHREGDGDAAEDAGDLRDYVDAAEDRGNWRTLRLVAPPGMTLDEFNLLVKNLQAAGNEVRVLKTDTDPQLEIRTPLANPKPVWETRIVDGQQRKVMRLVDEPAPYALSEVDPQPADNAGDNNGTPRGQGKFHRLGPGDMVLVRALGALPDQPLDGQFEVEEFGTLALGPAYGRVEVEGLTVLEAEAAVTKSLAQVLSDPKVQVTLLSRAKAAEDAADADTGDRYRAQ